eukprot:TRINITY_DN2771_c1_g1_i10.p1 TRINITY_DN2771_c1_g1~~TRINITY_DN2771_c1_g1_i10.p1  ORF type:complete len:530 (+),score=194.11 TRINITY_DN2771_c1_g1_i10:194-1783(+)
MNGNGRKKGTEMNGMTLRISGPPVLSFGSSPSNRTLNKRGEKSVANAENGRDESILNGDSPNLIFRMELGLKSSLNLCETEVKTALEPAKKLTNSFSSFINTLSKLTNEISKGSKGVATGKMLTPMRKSINSNGKIANPFTSVRKRLYEDEEDNEMREETSIRRTRHSAQTESLNRAIVERERYLKEIASDEGLKKTLDEEKKMRQKLLRKERRRKEKERIKSGNKEKGDKIINKPKENAGEPKKKEKQKRRKVSHYMSPIKANTIRIEDYAPEVQEALRRNEAVVELIEQIFDQLPDGHRISKKEELATNNANHNLDGFGSSTYGEILPVAIHNIISLLKIEEEDVFYDLGSGIGKAVIQVALQTKCKKSVGVELSETRYNLSLDAKQDAFNRLNTFEPDEINLLTPRRHPTQKETIKEVMDSISFVNNDILEVNFMDATCIYWNNICFNAAASLKIVAKFNELPEGTRILSSRKLCGRHSAACLRKKEPCSYMCLTKKDLVFCTWAVSCTVFIYEVRKRLVPNWWDQ